MPLGPGSVYPHIFAALNPDPGSQNVLDTTDLDPGPGSLIVVDPTDPDPDAGSQNFVDPIDLGLDPGSQNVADSTDPDPKHCTGAQVLEYLGLYIFIVKISPETVVGLARQDKTLLGKIPTKVFIKLATCDVVR